MTQLYDKYFTEQDIKDFIVFYKSPAGQKYINVMPEITKYMMTNMMTNIIPGMAKEMATRLDKLKEK
ncbi:MAG: DUF2059 domain-containing protein [Paludibacter sp.]